MSYNATCIGCSEFFSSSLATLCKKCNSTFCPKCVHMYQKYNKTIESECDYCKIPERKARFAEYQKQENNKMSENTRKRNEKMLKKRTQRLRPNGETDCIIL